MRPRFVTTLLACVAITTSLASAQNRTPLSPEEFFGLGKVWDIHIKITQEAWQKMFPPGGSNFGFAQQRPKFPYSKAEIEIAGHRAMVVGLRFKGHSTFSGSSGSLKRPFKVDLDRFVKGQKFLGLKKLNLHNNSTDGTQIKEAVCYKAYRDAGIPACRTAFARVYMTFGDKTQRAYVGLYTVIEQVDQRFAKRHFGARSTILKPEMQILGYHGDKWSEAYEGTYLPKTTVAPEHGEVVVRLAALSHKVSGSPPGTRRVGGFMRGGPFVPPEDPAAFRRELEAVMDVDGFLRYVAVTAILCNWDNPLNVAHNIYLILPSKKASSGVRNRVIWVPWDLNLVMSAMSGGPNANVLLPARMPLLRAVLGIEGYEKAYRKHVREIVGSSCSAETLKRSIAIAERATAKAIADEADRVEAVTRADPDPGRRGFGMNRRGRNGMRRPREDLAGFVTARAKSVVDQLDGKVVPTQRSGFGFGGNNRNFGRPRQATPVETLRDVLVANDAVSPGKSISKKDMRAVADACFAKLDANRSGSIDRAELTAGIQKHLDAGDTRRNPFAPGVRTLARRLRRDLDSNRSDGISKQELRKGCEKLFATFDTDKDGSLGATEIRGRPSGSR